MRKGTKSIIKTVTVGAAAMSLVAGAAFAGPAAPPKTVVPPAPESFYNAHEFYLSAAALLAAKTNSAGSDTSTAWGADLELGYFFTRNFGLALEGEYLDLGKPLWGSALNLYLRAPLSESSRWAPYLFGGAGALWNSEDARFEAHVGAGIEYRFTQKAGVFVDGRHTWVDGDQDNVPQFGLFRAGFKFVF